MDERESNMIRLGCLRDAVATVDIEQRNGFFKTKDNTEDVPTRINLYYQKYLELISEGKPRPEGFQTPQKAPDKPKEEQTPTEPRDATLPMKKCIWGLAFGTDAEPEAANELAILGLTKFNVTKAFVNYDWAHEFIDKYKKT
jgi:hypothetical protein